MITKLMEGNTHDTDHHVRTTARPIANYDH